MHLLGELILGVEALDVLGQEPVVVDSRRRSPRDQFGRCCLVWDPLRVASLGRRLFEQDRDHEAYWGAVSGLLQSADRSAIPDIVRHMSMNHLQHMASLMGLDFERSMPDLAESFADAYVLSGEEEWDDVDAETVSELTDECMVTVNRHRVAVGSDAIRRSDYSAWVSLAQVGLQSDLDEWAPLNSYVRLSGAWGRLEWVLPTYLAAGAYMADPRPDELEQWKALNVIAWRDGVVLFLLYRIGLLSTSVGSTSLVSNERPLSGTLFELDPEQYQLTAGRLMQTTAHAVPDVVKELYWYLIAPIVDRKLVDRFGQWLDDTFECGYVLCVSETWDDVEESALRELVDLVIRRVIAERDSRDPQILIADPEYRIRNIAYGIAGRTPWASDLNEYLYARGAMQRIEMQGDMLLVGIANSGAIKRRYLSKLRDPMVLSFWLGVSLGLLDQLGEVPSFMPQRLGE